MLSKFMTMTELKELTGTGTKQTTCKVLDANRVPYFLRADGWPVVTWDAIENLFGSRQKAPVKTTLTTDGFDLKAAHG